MRKIILASRSRARQRLLKEIGLKFTVVESRAREAKRLKGGCKVFVINNAFRKAQDVAKRFTSGVIIGADTVVLCGKKIIGKPKNMKEAYRALRTLSKRPQWVYTGIAVIDIDRGKTWTDYEKTKIWMYPLSIRQIKKYFRKISPFEHAGSFDVQGPGSVFIDRIEGCFYNVVGLPLAKLARILKKANIDIIE